MDGAIVDEADARISVFDRGFLYGDSVYEVMRTSRGRPVDLHQHLRRLARSADALALTLSDLSVLETHIQRTLDAAENAESYVRVMVTRGAGRIGLDTQLASEPVTIIIVRPLELPPAELYDTGASLEIVEVQRTSVRAMDPGVKSGNYLNNILALREAKRAGAYEALMCDAQGRVAEGSTSNVFVVRGGRISTPAQEIGLLAGNHPAGGHGSGSRRRHRYRRGHIAPRRCAQRRRGLHHQLDSRRPADYQGGRRGRRKGRCRRHDSAHDVAL
jgi:branched-chain amino acid aminotransferase